MRRATSRRNGARDGQSTTSKRNATTSDALRTTQTPLPARRIAHTSRITHRHPHEHTRWEMTPPRASQRPRRATRDDETRRRRDTTPRTQDATTTACLPTTRRLTATATALPAPRHDGTGREAGRRKRETRRDDGRDEKNGPPLEKKGGQKNGTRYEIKREDCYSPSLSESSGKRGKSRRRER